MRRSAVRGIAGRLKEELVAAEVFDCEEFAGRAAGGEFHQASVDAYTVVVMNEEVAGSEGSDAFESLAFTPSGSGTPLLPHAENLFVGDDSEGLVFPDEALGNFDHAQLEPARERPMPYRSRLRHNLAFEFVFFEQCL